jgi:AraC-like DNA-binding protein
MLVNALRPPPRLVNAMPMTAANQPGMGNTDPHPPATPEWLASIREDTARLSRILCNLNCDAAIVGIHGPTLATIAQSSARPSGCESNPAAQRPTARMRSTVPALCAGIYDPRGRLFASLRLTTVELDRSEAFTQVLRALIESAARAITERLFRMSYRGFWIIAAQPLDAPEASFLLAVDHDGSLVGGDRPARQFLRMRGRPLESRASLFAVFKLDTAALRESGVDVAHRVLGRDGGALYSVLITPPDRAPRRSPHDERLLLHTRPRLDLITDPEIEVPAAGQASGLRPHLLRSVQHYINTHLDCALTNEVLAAAVGLSASHFCRGFMRSVGTSPHKYVIRLRVGRAQRLLAETDLPLADIALTTGFADQSHFSRRFLQVVGLQPSAFRKQHR